MRAVDVMVGLLKQQGLVYDEFSFFTARGGVPGSLFAALCWRHLDR
jgi:hypothetical protein